MINVPSSLQNAWDDVSKDGKIDKADVKKLVEAAAPGITKAKTAEELDQALTNELDKEESDFLANFSSTKNGSTLAIKNGTAKGTFEFVNAPATDNSKKEEVPSGSVIKLFEPLSLPVAGKGIKPEGNNGPYKTGGLIDNADPNSSNSTEGKIKKLVILKDSLPNILKEPELSEQLKNIEGKIKVLQEQLVSEKAKTAETSTEKPVETVKTQTEENNTKPPVQVDKAKILESNKANVGVTLEGLHDVIGNGFFNARNKEGTCAMFQLLANQGLLDETIVKLNSEDQIQAIKILSSGTNVFNHAIAARIYANLSKSANLEDEFNEDQLPILKNTTQEIGGNTIEPNQYAKGMKYSIYNEKEAAMTMARGIINREIDGFVLTKLSRSDLDALVRLVDQKGTSEEKENLSKVIAETYNKDNTSVKIDYLSNENKAKIFKEIVVANPNDEKKIESTIKQMGKNVIFEAVNNQSFSDYQLAVIAKHTDGDDMADKPAVASKLLLGMIKSYNQDQTAPVTLADINSFIDEISKDWWDDEEVMKRLLRELSDGPDSPYARFKALAPATMDKIWKIYS